MNPGASNASPGVTATRASWSSASAKSSDVRKPSTDSTTPTPTNIEKHPADVPERVEGAGRLLAAQPRIGGEPLVQQIATVAILVQHRANRVLRPRERLDRSLLGD